MRHTLRRFALGTAVAGMLGSAACAPVIDGGDGSDAAKDAARGSGGKADDGSDTCAAEGWYDDGVCDPFCAEPDPACGAARDPVAEVRAFNAGLAERDRQDKYCKMAASPFSFFRGADHLFWLDLGRDPRLARFGGDADTRTWIQGDLHTDNFGAFADDQGTLVFDLNDFDEAVVADYQLDVWRHATSLVLALRELGLDDGAIATVVDAFSASYLAAIGDFAGGDGERDAQVSAASGGLLGGFLGEVAGDESRSKMLGKWTTTASGARRFKAVSKKLELAGDDDARLVRDAWPAYLTTVSGTLAGRADVLAIKDVARRVGAGTGSYGMRRFYVLVEGPTSAADDDRILEVKAQRQPAAWAYLDDAVWRELGERYANPAARITAAARALAADPDDHLGWFVAGDTSYTVRELSPFKASFELGEHRAPAQLIELAQGHGRILAAAHARASAAAAAVAGQGAAFDTRVLLRTQGDPAAFAALVLEVARAEADRVAADFALFVPALASGCN